MEKAGISPPTTHSFHDSFRENPLAFIFLGLILFSIFGTILRMTLEVDATVVQNVVSMLLIVSAGGAVLHGFLKTATNSNLAVLVGAGLVITIGALAEIVGVFTGAVFGDYRYTDAWWPTVQFGSEHYFPLLMPIAWFMIVGGSVLYCVSRVGGRGFWVAIPLAVLADLVMEPLMVQGFGYWIWKYPLEVLSAPAQNILGWAWVSALAVFALRMSTGRLLEPRLRWVHSVPLLGFVFFVAVMGALYSQMFSAIGGGLLFCALLILLLKHHRKVGTVRESDVR